MAEEVVFRREGARFVATECAVGPWAADRLHGGPVFGLLARGIEAELNDPELMAARLTFDLFRAVPLTAFEVRTEVVRRSARLCVARASLVAEDEEYARAGALLLRASEAQPQPSAAGALGPEELATESLMRAPPGVALRVPPGYHTRVHTRWVPRQAGEPLAIWFHLPMPLVEGEVPSPLQRAAALSDFANAVASIAARERDANAVPYINVDSTVYLSRRPEGEWYCLREGSLTEEGGVSITEVTLADASGPLGRVLQARLEAAPRR